MLLSIQLHSDALQQPVASAVKRSTNTRLRSLQPIGDLAASKAFDVTKFKQFSIRGIQLFSTAFQGSQREIRSAALGAKSSFRKNVQQFVANAG
jgi:hypothetical protein